MRYLMAVCLLMEVAGCARSPVAPSTDVSGVWIGLSSTALGAETFTFTVAQGGLLLSGAWSVVFSAAPSANQSGRLSGNVDLGAVLLTLTPDIQPNCNYVFNATLTTITKMDGQLQTANCTTSSVESLELIKQ